MDPKLQAGVEIALQKTAEEQSGHLSRALILQADEFGFGKDAEEQGVEEKHKSGAGTPSSNKSPGMEDKNKNYGKGEVKLDDDPTKGKKSQETGETVNAHAGAHITTEASGMPDLSMKNATDRRSALQDVISRQLRG